jgi:hypothetical protein
MRVARPLAALAIAATAAALAACGGSTPSAQSADVIVCQHYKVQRAYVKNLAEPTLADAIKFEGWIAVDAAQATPGTALARDLDAMSADEQHLTSSYDASARVLADCTALGVKP